MVLGQIADTLTRSVENAGQTVSQAFLEPVVRLGVTGVSRSGKTVFITSLVANLIDRARMGQMRVVANGALRTAYLQPQPDDTLPRFAYEDHLGALLGPEPRWPNSTRSVSELRLSMRIQPGGFLGSFSGPRTVHLDIVDYPGEWLLDLGLLDKSFAAWSKEALERARARADGAAYLAQLETVDGTAALDEPLAQDLAAGFTAYLRAAREAGFSDCTPGRFLLPGDLEGSPVLTFSPLPETGAAGRRSLWREFERRFESYKANVVKPFFRNHFARIDRQVVLVDALGAIHAGPAALDDLRQTLADVLGAFRPGQNAFLTQLFLGKRVEKILFAATKADHLHHSQHARLSGIMEALVKEARGRADFAGAETKAMSIAALRATVEETRLHQGHELGCVRGTLLETGTSAAFYPGELPEDPASLLSEARDQGAAWLDAEFGAMRFAPARMTLKPGEGPPHIRLDRAAEFLLGDRL